MALVKSVSFSDTEKVGVWPTLFPHDKTLIYAVAADLRKLAFVKPSPTRAKARSPVTENATALPEFATGGGDRAIQAGNRNCNIF